MKTAREELNRATTLAFSIRKKAIELEAEVVTATEVTSAHPSIYAALPTQRYLKMLKSEEAVQTIMETARLATESLKVANDAELTLRKLL